MPAGKIEEIIVKYDTFNGCCGSFWGNEVNRIQCISDKGYVGILSFYPKGLVPKSQISTSVDGTLLFWLTYENDRYQEIIETLRYEKPVWICIYWDDNYDIVDGSVNLGDEPVGEQEGAGAPPT